MEAMVKGLFSILPFTKRERPLGSICEDARVKLQVCAINIATPLAFPVPGE